MSDNYEFSKSTFPQGISAETPYVSKNWNYVNDINGGVYSNNGLTLVQFDLSSIYNSSCLIDPSQAYITVPLVLVSAYTSSNSAGTLVTPTNITGQSTTHGLKSGYWNLLHGSDLIVNAQTLEQFQPNINTYVNWKMMSQMSQDDLNGFGQSLGMGNVLDNAQSLKFNPASSQTTATAFTYPVSTNTSLSSTATGGNGISNNTPFSATANYGDQGTATLPQFTGCYNNGLYSRLKKYNDITATSPQNLYGVTAGTGSLASSIMSETNIINEFKSYTKIIGNYIVTYDVAVIRLCDILDSMKQMVLMKKFDGVLRMYLNTGCVSSCVQSGGFMLTSASSSTFTNTCPIIQCSLATIPATATGLTTGLFIARATTSNSFGVNLGLSYAMHGMTSCRCYYPQVMLKPQKLISYLSENRAKKICYTSVLYNSFNGVASGSTFSGLVQSGVTGIRGVLIIPFNSSLTNGSVSTLAPIISGVTTFSQISSPFDTAPCTNGNFSLLNLQVGIGGQNVLANNLNYTYENFLQQTVLYEKINSGDIGLSCGLISQSFWENAYRCYYVDCSRGTISDSITPRNITVTFTNNTNCTLDFMVFTEYFSEIIVDVETGLVRKN